MQICRRGATLLLVRFRRKFGSRLCRSNAQVSPKANGATACRNGALSNA